MGYRFVRTDHFGFGKVLISAAQSTPSSFNLILINRLTSTRLGVFLGFEIFYERVQSMNLDLFYDVRRENAIIEALGRKSSRLMTGN